MVGVTMSVMVEGDLFRSEQGLRRYLRVVNEGRLKYLRLESLLKRMDDLARALKVVDRESSVPTTRKGRVGSKACLYGKESWAKQADVDLVRLDWKLCVVDLRMRECQTNGDVWDVA